MVHVNRNELSDKELGRLIREFDATLNKLNLRSTTILLDELLGKEERLVIAKRLIAIILLTEGYSSYQVSQILKLSPTTTGILSERIRTGAYAGIIGTLQKKKLDYKSLLETVDSILHLGGLLPHRVGMDRYKRF